ncbi:hypothetical protein JST97_19190 [bacterium]|nr:hypothetical protein [bacterium]
MNALTLKSPIENFGMQIFKDIARRLRSQLGSGRESDIRAGLERQPQHSTPSRGQATRYGSSFLQALQSECPGVYKDWGQLELHSDLWEKAIGPSLEKGVGVLIGLNGEFSLHCRGQVVLIVGLLGANLVVYADPASGSFRTTTRWAMEKCPPHPDGKFVFAAA